MQASNYDAGVRNDFCLEINKQVSTLKTRMILLSRHFSIVLKAAACLIV